LPRVSTTFHGRDIMAPVAARLAAGLDPDVLGPSLERLTTISWPQAHTAPGRIDGVVIEIDAFGNLITNITAEMLAGRPTDRRACVVCNIYETWGIYQAYAEQPSGMLVALIDSSDRLELALVGDNAARRLGVVIGSPVTLAWE
jgi:S-adenosylmethionine hydrolase